MTKMKKLPVRILVLKYFILALFILLPILAFRLGMAYERQHGSNYLSNKVQHLP
jgi:hypothetical protein